MKLKDLDLYLQELLNLNDFTGVDSSLNGLQVGDYEAQINCCGFAVDACQETIERAVAVGAQLLFVHHGFFWGRPLPIRGNHFKRVKALLDGGLALYAAHLPLDAHPMLGNNSSLGMQLGLTEVEPFGLYKGKKIGVRGILPIPLTIDEILSKLGTNRENCPSVFPFGKRQIEQIGIISGGASREVEEAIDEKLDLYITGESSHEIYHTCLEAKINLIAAGHYFTETGGVHAIAKKLKEDLQLKTVFIDIPTNL